MTHSADLKLVSAATTGSSSSSDGVDGSSSRSSNGGGGGGGGEGVVEENANNASTSGTSAAAARESGDAQMQIQSVSARRWRRVGKEGVYAAKSLRGRVDVWWLAVGTTRELTPQDSAALTRLFFTIISHHQCPK